jgi:hypothetical protein
MAMTERSAEGPSPLLSPSLPPSPPSRPSCGAGDGTQTLSR